MTQLQDAMTAACTNLASQHGVTTDQVNTIVAGAVSPLQTQIQTILSSEQSDEAKLADVTAAVTEFTAAFAPAAPAPASTPAPNAVVPAPTPAVGPSPAPDSVAPAPTPAPATAS